MPPEAITALAGFPIEPPEARLTAPEMNGLLCPPQQGNWAMLMGIGAAESIIRMRAVTRRRHDNYIVKWNEHTGQGNVWKAYPIYDWSTKDVWTAPALKGWDYNRAYDLMEMAGVPAGLQRCSPAFGEEPLQKIHTYAACFPDVWAKMVNRVPSVGAAARYALTELYSYGGRPQKPTGMAWPDFLRHYLTKFQPQDAQHIASRIQGWIGNHYRKTTLPILENAPHPDSGVTWNALLAIAMRGDFKNRRQPGAALVMDGHGRAQPKLWHSYAAELAQILADGRYDELACPAPPPADLAAIIPDYAKDAS